MGDEGGYFMEACGMKGPLRLEWNDWTSGELVGREFRRPTVLVGQNWRADLVMDHPSVGRRHAYLQCVDGQFFAVDLASRKGLNWDGVPRAAGWVDQTPLQIGSIAVRVGGLERGAGEPGAGPAPTSARYVSSRPLPGAVLEIHQPEERPRRCPMDRVLVLVGSSDRCKVRLTDPGSSRFVFGLIRTPEGVWLVDLLSSLGLTVNGAACGGSRLEDGDVIQVGRTTIRLLYNGKTARALPREKALPSPVALPFRPSESPAPGLSLPFAVEEAGELSPEAILRPFLEMAGSNPGAPSPFGEALVLMVRLLGDVHRDHLTLVRSELDHIRRLGREMEGLRAQTSRPAPWTLAPAADDALPKPAGPPRPDPETVRAVIGERLETWETARQSRWRRILNLLVNR